MTVIVKMMGSEDAPDSDTRKTYHLYTDVLKIEFFREGDDAYAWLWFPPVPFSPNEGDAQIQKEKFLLLGNVYVMNNDGKTISSFGITKIPGVDYKGGGPSAEYDRHVHCMFCGDGINSEPPYTVTAQQSAVDQHWAVMEDGWLCSKQRCVMLYAENSTRSRDAKAAVTNRYAEQTIALSRGTDRFCEPRPLSRGKRG